MAAYLINRLPSKVIQNHSSFEILFRRKPNYDHLRVFGCLLYAKDNTQTEKLSAHSRVGVFVGYPVGQMGYKVFYFDRKKIYTSHDVLFFKDIFPFL